MDLILATEDIDRTYKEIKEYMNTIETSCEALDSFFNTTIQVCREGLTESNLAMLNAKYIQTTHKVGYEYNTISKEDFDISLEESKIGEFFRKTIEGIIKAYYYVINLFKKLFNKLMTSNTLISRDIDKLQNKIHQLSIANCTVAFTKEELSGINNKFATILEAYSDVDNVNKLIEILIELEDQITEPKLTTKLAIGIRNKLSGDLIMTKELNNSELMTFIGDLYPKNSNRELTNLFKLNTNKDKIEYDRISVVRFYGNLCDSVVNTTDYGSKFISLKIQHGNKELHNGVRTDLLKNFIDYTKNINDNMGGFKDSVNKSIATGKDLIDKLKSTENLVPDEHNEVGIMRRNIRYIKQLSGLIPTLGNANITNYFHMTKNMLWLAKLCYSKYENTNG